MGDYNNDGFLDLFVTALENGKTYLYRNRGDGTFEIDDRSKQMQQLLQKVVGFDTRFFDFDNDGFLDLLVAGKPVDAGSQVHAVLLCEGSEFLSDLQAAASPGHLAKRDDYPSRSRTGVVVYGRRRQLLGPVQRQREGIELGQHRVAQSGSAGAVEGAFATLSTSLS